MEAVVREIDHWPPPVPGQIVHLPLIGVLFQVNWFKSYINKKCRTYVSTLDYKCFVIEIMDTNVIVSINKYCLKISDGYFFYKNAQNVYKNA